MTHVTHVIHQHPLAFLAGLEGIALMRAFAGEHDADFVQARLDRLRALLDGTDPASALLGRPADLEPLTVSEAYDGWAASYDGPNTAFDYEEQVVLPILDRLPPGVAVDAATGTGRVAARLVQRGHRVLGLDLTRAMLGLARTKLPTAGFAQADLCRIPVRSESVDLVTCSLALSHQPELGPALGEFARVLRPGGHLVVADTRGEFAGSPLYPLVKQTVEGRWGYLPNFRHRVSDYLGAALPWFEVRECREIAREPWSLEDFETPSAAQAGTPPDFWSLMDHDPAAAIAAYAGARALIVWHFQKR
jgi:ubiquinone/menaquinone biosynthesis C-methylase UbiE